MRALDVHAHLGKDVVFGHVITEENLLDGYKDTIVQGAIVQPSLPRFSLKANKEIHDRIFEFSKCDKMKIWGMASIYPHFTQEEYREEAIRCVKELGFVGLKLTPIGHACDPESEDGRTRGVPCDLLHPRHTYDRTYLFHRCFLKRGGLDGIRKLDRYGYRSG